MDERNIAKKLGIKIRKQRESHKMTLDQAAKLIGVSANKMNRFENGELCIDIDSLFQFAYLFNMEPVVFLCGVVNLNNGVSKTIH